MAGSKSPVKRSPEIAVPVAACADSIGADIIELAPVKNLREDMIIYKTIAGKVINNADDFAEIFLEKELVAVVPGTYG
mgnify:CR=1 FL=1